MRKMRWAAHLLCIGEIRGAFKVLVGIGEGRRPLEKPRRRWKDNVIMCLKEVEWWSMGWTDQDRDTWRNHVNAMMNLRVHKMRGIS
jgi:hypothetical protein